jgi:hypothetical protein
MERPVKPDVRVVPVPALAEKAAAEKPRLPGNQRRLAIVKNKATELRNDGKNLAFHCLIQVVDTDPEGEPSVLMEETFAVNLEEKPGMTTEMLQSFIDERKAQLRNRAANLASIDFTALG